MYVYFYKRIFEEKYSSAVTFRITFLLWMIQFFTKIVPSFVLGLEMTVFLSLLMMILHMVHLFVLFEGTVLKRTVALVMAIIVQASMDFLGLNLTSKIVGNYELLQVGSEFTIVALFASCTTITIGMVLLTKIWKLIENIDWKMTKKEWFCVLLPISQIFFLWHMIVRYSVNYKVIPVMTMNGCILGLIADVYMLLLFVRLSKKNETKKQLEGLKHQQELEQMRYEQLKKSQEETAKIRHDFQNYILTLKRME